MADPAALRRWTLTPTDPYCAIIAADARYSATDYDDDQSWELQLGTSDAPALAFSTRYGGRLGLASLVPLFTLDGAPHYAAQDFSSPPALVGFAPAYLRAEAALTPSLDVVSEYFVFESRAAGGRFTLNNQGAAPVSMRCDLVGFAAAEGRELRVALLPTEQGHALTFGKVGNFRPVIVVESGASDGLSTSRVGVAITVPAGGEAVVRWAHGGERSAAASLALAKRWLARDWDAVRDRALRGQAQIPHIETGDADLDALLAASYQQLLQAFLNPTAHLPKPSPVGTRHPGRGFSPRPNGADHPRAWAGQSPALTYLTALAIAPVDAGWAQGIVRNLLAVQRDDGWIDWRPGLGGQRQGLLYLPLLARLTWGIFQFTEDDAFLREVFPGLLRFLRRWQADDLDADGDGWPEWQADVQTGYPYFPTFGRGYPWAQNADIRTAETPSLLAFLLSEAISLREIAWYLRESVAEAECVALVEKLTTALEALWAGDRYAYRDRDTHQTTSGRSVFSDAPADAPLFLAEPLDPPARLLITVQGGAEHTPRLQLTVEGRDAHGEPAREVITPDQLVWTHSRGAVTTQTAFSVVDALHPEGLIRVYRMSGATVDWTRRDLNALLPLWIPGLNEDRAAPLVDFYQSALAVPNGVTMVATDDPAFKPDHKDGAGGVWPFWLTLIAEGLLEAGRTHEAADLTMRLLQAQVEVLRANKVFSEYYHTEASVGLGEQGAVSGMAPLYVFLRLAGLRILSAHKVWAGGDYPFEQPITVRQLGVTIVRSAQGTQVRFPSGRVVELPVDAPLTEVTDHPAESLA
jgi:hypothetical protein